MKAPYRFEWLTIHASVLPATVQVRRKLAGPVVAKAAVDPGVFRWSVTCLSLGVWLMQGGSVGGLGLGYPPVLSDM